MITMSGAGPVEPAHLLARGGTRLWQLLLASSGVTFVGIGLVGILLPGVPTTVPLLVATYLLAKSNPAWERKLVALPLVRRYVGSWNGSTKLPLRARIGATVGMWTSIAVSCFVVNSSTSVITPLIAGLLLLGLVGTAAIWLYQSSCWNLVTFHRAGVRDVQGS